MIERVRYCAVHGMCAVRNVPGYKSCIGCMDNKK